ncbi:MAG: lysylphosphatidylglycerol synthase transmembrane domain-containing protein [Saprospiraceae bacterium]|nr:lysylphosphatidylglycerol synthase transmembrane domain-containing protein [Saprospiraceae bacterium]
MNKRWLNAVKVIAFLAAGSLLLYLIYKNQSVAYQADCILRGIPVGECDLLDKLIEDFKRANIGWLAVIVIAFMLSNISRALRWNQLLRPLGYSPKLYNSFFTIMFGYFANLGIPRIGEIARAGLQSRYEQIPMQKVLGTVVTDRLADILCLAIIIFLAFSLEFDRLYNFVADNAQSPVSLAAIIGHPGFWIVLICLAGAIYIFRNTLRRIWYGGVKTRVKNFAVGFAEGIATIRRLENTWLFVFHSVFIWTMYFLMTYLCFKAFPPTGHLGLQAGLVVFTLGSLGMVIPMPGGMGSYHYLVIKGLAFYQIAEVDGFSFAMIIFFTIQLFCNIAFGILALIMLPILNGRIRS